MFFCLCTCFSTYGQRYMENLGRGTVAVRSSSSQVFVSWRILGLEFNSGVRYNLYRNSTRIATNLNVSNFLDNNSSNSSTYSVSAVVNGVEQGRSPGVGVTTYIHGGNPIPCLTVPIRVTSGYAPKFIWTGDLNGDGELDFVFTKIPTDPARHILLEAYTRTGTFLWQLDCGPNSVNKYNIEPGSSTLDIGHGDNITVYDLNNDGRAEVIVRIANGVRFGDGTTFTHSDNNRQFIAVLNGMTGALLGYRNVPTNYLSDGPMNGHMGIAYLDGVNPSVVWSAKNRIGSGDFNMMITAYSWRGGNVNLNWTFLRPNGAFPEGHNIRCVDLDGDGRDEIFPMGFALRPDGTVLYSLGSRGIVHGDRFQIGKFDPNRAGLQGYVIQQNNASGLAWAYYDARNGAILQSQTRPGVVDYGRGLAGDFDPRYAGWEFWTFTDGMYNISGARTSSAMPDSYPNMRIFWDGDVMSENLDNFKMTKWNYASSTEGRLLTFRDAMQVGAKVPGLYGDIIGDWREEVVYTSSDLTKLLIFTTTTPTSTRLYTLLHNPEYRLCLTNRGYYQSTMLDFYVGNGMSTPPTPNIRYVGGASRASVDDMALVTDESVERNVFPNPSRNEFNIKEAGKFTYAIKDQAGNILEQGSGEEQIVAGGNLKAGLYVVDIQSETGTKQIKVIKKN